MTESSVYLHETIDKYLRELSARRIVPGGGSAAAVAASLGAALNLMVINYSIKEEGMRTEDKELVVLKTKQEEGLNRLSVMIDEDCKVFSALMKSLSSGEEAEERYMKAAAVPMDICRECCTSMEITAVLLENCNRSLMTDVGCAGHVLKAAFHSARLNVFINLKHIKDNGFGQKAREEIKRLDKEIEGMAGKITREVEEWLKS